MEISIGINKITLDSSGLKISINGVETVIDSTGLNIYERIGLTGSMDNIRTIYNSHTPSVCRYSVGPVRDICHYSGNINMDIKLYSNDIKIQNGILELDNGLQTAIIYHYLPIDELEKTTKF